MQRLRAEARPGSAGVPARMRRLLKPSLRTWKPLRGWREPLWSNARLRARNDGLELISPLVGGVSAVLYLLSVTQHLPQTLI
jgi:hypothetical protein